MPRVATLGPRPAIAPLSDHIAAATEMPGAVKSVAIFCGAGRRGAEAELLALAERLKAPLLHMYRTGELMP